jgi:hypothetical protein
MSPAWEGAGRTGADVQGFWKKAVTFLKKSNQKIFATGGV